MNRTIQGDGRIRHFGSPTGIVGGLLLISLGLQLLAHQVFGQTDVGTLLWAHYLGFWSYILGTTGFLFLTVRWLIEWRHVRASLGARTPWSSTQSNGSRFEKPEQLDVPLQMLRPGAASVDFTSVRSNKD